MQRYALITYSLRLIPYGCADCIQPVVDDMQCVALMICIRYANDDIPIRGLTIPQSAVPTAPFTQGSLLGGEIWKHLIHRKRFPFPSRGRQGVGLEWGYRRHCQILHYGYACVLNDGDKKREHIGS